MVNLAGQKVFVIGIQKVQIIINTSINFSFQNISKNRLTLPVSKLLVKFLETASKFALLALCSYKAVFSSLAIVDFDKGRREYHHSHLKMIKDSFFLDRPLNPRNFWLANTRQCGGVL